jgi:hypothetical protein
MFSIVSAVRISRTSRFLTSGHLCPFALRVAFPLSLVGRYSHDYYGHSVTLGLAPLRRSRIPSQMNVQSDLGSPFISLNEFITHRP